MFYRQSSRLLIAISIAFSATTLHAGPLGIFTVVADKPIREIWLNPGFYSYHFQEYRNLNNNNFGLGGEYRYSTIGSFTLGAFHNSARQTSHYLGWYWQPLSLGNVRLGGVVGALDGYPTMLEGGWFLAVIPAASFEYQNFGASLLYTPNYKDRIYGALSLQLKFRVH